MKWLNKKCCVVQRQFKYLLVLLLSFSLMANGFSKIKDEDPASIRSGRSPKIYFPSGLRGSWYSWDYGSSKEISITRTQINLWGQPLLHSSRRVDVNDYLFFQASGCLVCSRFISRSWNIVERVDSQCLSINLTSEDLEMIAKVGCGHVFDVRARENGAPLEFTKDLPQRGQMMYREDYSPVNCRHSVYGSYRFSYQITDSFTGECQNLRSRLHSCDVIGTQFLISNQKFLLDFSSCEGMKNSYDGSGEFICLGEWMEGLQHYFVAVNLRESRIEERFRCFLKNREDPYFVGMSRSPSCRMLKTPENSPVRMRLEPVRDIVQASCLFPKNISGSWMSSGPGEPLVEINDTHIVETRWVGYQSRKDVSVCIQKKGTRFLLAKVSEFGCQTEYVCWELLPRHHNIIRFRKGRPLIANTFEVCDFGNFGKKRHWKYDTLIKEEPAPIQCPFSGRFSFGQTGSVPLRTRLLDGITRSPLDSYPCPDRETDLSICDIGRKHIIIDMDRCSSLNIDGRPMEVKSLPDYHLNCVGFWKENLNSYLVTHDPFDSVSRFRCWVYQRVSMTEIRLSQGLGSACGLRQIYSSAKLYDGAALALNLSLRETLYDQCPMYYDDGSDPWKPPKNDLTIFRFRSSSTSLRPKLLTYVFFVTFSVSYLLIPFSSFVFLFSCNKYT